MRKRATNLSRTILNVKTVRKMVSTMRNKRH